MSLVSACTRWARTGAHCLPHTCGLLNVGQSPHGELLSVVRLAGVTRSWSDALIPEFAQVCDTQLLPTTVSPQFSANSLMQLLCKGLGTRRERGTIKQKQPVAPSPASQWHRITFPTWPQSGQTVLSLAALRLNGVLNWVLKYHI